MIIKNKKGDAPIIETVIFITLNVAFFVLFLVFIFRSAAGAVVYEQAYAKQIALLLDGAKPGMAIVVNFEPGIRIADKNKQNLDEAVKINNETNSVIVSLLPGKGGVSYQFFSDYNIQTRLDKTSLIINVGEKNE